MPTMERIPISEWEQQASYSSHTTPSCIAIAPTVSECKSDIAYYPTTAQPAADDKQQRPNDTTSSSTAACPVANNTSRSTNTNRLNDDDEEDSDEEIGAMVYASSNTERARKAAAEAASAVNSNQSSSSYEPRSEVHKRKSLNNSGSNSKEMKSAVKKKRVTKSFEQRLADLQSYKAKHGHIKVKRSEDKSLYSFCINMRYARNNPEKSTFIIITDDRIASLDALGFEWSLDSRFKSFEQRIEDLRAYKEKNGHIKVKKSDGESLYKFCGNMRHARNNPEKSTTTMTLTDDRIASLNALGFDWRAAAEAASAVSSNQSSSSYEPRSEVRKREISSDISSNEMESAPKKMRVTNSFARRMDELRAYKEKHGHTTVKEREDKSLYRFCKSMRRARHNPETSNTIINDDRIASLDALGFNWSAGRGEAATKSFEQRIADLEAYKEKNGHADVKRSEDRSLYDFCNHMRRARNNPEKSNMTLTDERIASLNALGFEWAVIEQKAIKSFEQRIEDLRAYKEKNGHVNVKRREDKSLNGFCQKIRYARNNPEKSDRNLNDDRITSLDALGFDWAVSERKTKKTFDQRVADLREYKGKYGHVNVKKSDDKSLYHFCRDMRYARNNPAKYDRNLIDDRIASLDALGFDWSVSERQAVKSFEQRIENLQAYKEKHGHVNVKEGEDKSLYNWLGDVRRARINPEKSDRALTDDRIASLDALGFDWRMS